MKFKSTLAIVACAVMSLPVLAQRTTVPANRDWKFSYGDVPGAQKPDFDDSKWQTINVPHDYQIHQPWVAPSADEMPDSDNPVASVRSSLSSHGFKEMG